MNWSRCKVSRLLQQGRLQLDRFVRNNGDGTFTNILEQMVPQTTWFSMGADVADMNNDGRFDLFTTDMAATTHYKAKISMGNMQDWRWGLENFWPRQAMRNNFFLNTGTERFMEIAFMTGLSSTDWTWGVRLADLDNDHRLDIAACAERGANELRWWRNEGP